MVKEQTLVIFKPDIIQRQVIGELLTRFEKKGFKPIAMKMMVPSPELIDKHYIDSDDYNIEVGRKAIKSAEERGEKIEDRSPLEIGRQIRRWNVEYLTCGPVLVMVFEGAHVIESVRKMIGKTNPILADVGTIRADYTPDSYLLADMQGRTTRTMVHASDSIKSARREIPLWFDKKELVNYETAIEKILYDVGWTK